MQTSYFDPVAETLDREALRKLQLDKFHNVLREVLKTHHFYRRKLAEAGMKRPEDLPTLEHCRNLPFTTKEELLPDQKANPPYGTNLTFPRQRYHPNSLDLRNDGRAVALAGHPGKLELVGPLLGGRLQRCRSRPGGSNLLRLLLWPFHRFLGRPRRGTADRLAVDPRGRNVNRWGG